jgi:hypothetical protein
LGISRFAKLAPLAQHLQGCTPRARSISRRVPTSAPLRKQHGARSSAQLPPTLRSCACMVCRSGQRTGNFPSISFAPSRLPPPLRSASHNGAHCTLKGTMNLLGAQAFTKRTTLQDHLRRHLANINLGILRIIGRAALGHRSLLRKRPEPPPLRLGNLIERFHRATKRHDRQSNSRARHNGSTLHFAPALSHRPAICLRTPV